MIKKTDALQSLRPGAEWVLRGDNLEWMDTKQTKPTEAEIAEEITRLQEEYDTKEYARKRAVEYPALNEQLDMLWHAIDEGKLNKYSDFYKKLKSVKEKYPKSGE
jgi:4-hydroxyphenylpyruvate dioxygenase-like putative hemolysin